MTGIIVSVPPTVELPPGSTSGGTVSLPPVTYQYAILNIPQTWTALQTFTFGLTVSGPTTLNSPQINSPTGILFSNIGGNIAVSQMNSGTGADNTKFWRGDGTWATPAVAVSSVFSRTGAVVGTSGDYTYSANTIAYAARFWQGYQHSNDVGAPNTKIDIAAGSCRDSTDALNITNSSGTIDCGTVGANGLDASTLAVSTWYYTFAITTSGGTTAFLASTSPTAPTLPATYTKFRRIGSFLTDASAHIIAFTHVNNIWTWASSPRDYNAIPTLDTATLATISVPRIQGIVAIFAATAFTSPAVATASTAYVYPGFMTSTARTGFALGSWANTNGVAQASRCQVDSSGRVNVFTHSAGTDPIKVVLDIAGWVDDL